MQNAIINLIRYAKANNGVISVFDGEEWALKRSDNERDIYEAITSTVESNIIISHVSELIKDSNKHVRLGVAYIVNGLDNDELVADFTDNEYMNNWFKQYNKGE